MIRIVNRLGFLFLAFVLGVYTQSAKGACQAHDDHPMIDQLCGIDMPISDTIFYENTSDEPIILWRVFNMEYPESATGRWWSLDIPTQFTREEYRKANAICPEWSSLSGITRCTLKPGGKFMIGHTEAVQCKDVEYPASDTLQIFLVDPWEDLHNCSAWTWEE